MGILIVVMGFFIIVVQPASGDGTAVPGNLESIESVEHVNLPAPHISGDLSVEEAIHQRRSVRDFSAAPIKLNEIGQLVWAAQGITASGHLRAAPSAGALYPLELYIVAGNVESLPPGVYKYSPEKHQLMLLRSGDFRKSLQAAALGQNWVGEAPVSLVLTGVVERTAVRYGDRAQRYMLLEAGHAAENVFLQALSCHLGSVMIGAFLDEDVADVIGSADGEEPIAIIPVGR